MTFQGLSPERSKIEQLMEMDGAAMVGTKIKAPFGLVPEVYVLPMDNVWARGQSCFDSFRSRLF
jgi:leucyl-tRNA synthetase